VTLNDIAACLKISHGSAHHIVHDVLQFHKVSARWVPRQLTPEMRQRRVDACEELLRRFEREGDGFLARTVTGDETWVYFHQPEKKRASREWRHSSSPKQKKFRTETSAGKVMLTLFWDEKGVILEHYTPRGTTVTSASYSDLLKIVFGLQSNQSDVDCCHQVSFCNMTMQGPTLPVQQLQQSQTCILSVFLIHHTHQTLPQVISICLDHSKSNGRKEVPF